MIDPLRQIDILTRKQAQCIGRKSRLFPARIPSALNHNT